VKLTHGSLFTGIGGIDLGFERAGIETVWQVEIDDYATKVLEKHWPNVERFRDVTRVGRDNLRPVDIISGGFPCQDISAANQRGEGLSGGRSGLFYELLRIVSGLRPRFLLLENSPVLASRGLGSVLGSLAEVGYDAEWDCLSVSSFGAFHKRERLFLVAYPACVRRRDAGPLILGDACEDRAEGRGFECRRGSSGRVFPFPDTDIFGMADGVADRAHRLRCVGNGVYPPIAEWIGRRIMDFSRAE